MTLPRSPVRFLFALGASVSVGCAGVDADPVATSPDVGRRAPPHTDSGLAPISPTRAIEVRVTLDGVPIEGATVVQPGTARHWTTDEDGVAQVDLDTRVEMLGLVASHPEARTAGDELWGDPPWEEGYDIALSTVDWSDNAAYVFQDPGTPERRATTDFCAHCHITLNEDWVGSAHATSASNPRVQDLYAGVAAALSTEGACEAAGGRWRTGLAPGTGLPAERCYLGVGALPDLNLDCGEDVPCDGIADETAQCADCHAPGIDGRIGGRDLLEATGLAYDHGVHCDVCHKVESVDLDNPNPGVAGALRIVRPSEESPSPSFGDFAPLMFGPYGDVANPRMGAVHRDHFATAEFCGGCHEHHAPALVPGASVDTTRWPDGKLPVQTTYSELRDGPLGEDVLCQSCHMPPDPTVGNSADLGNLIDIGEGIAGGWYREPGSVRRHVWFGPRSAEQRMVDLAAALFVEKTVSDGILTASVTTRNVGPGHALPTGEPMRQLHLLVRAHCEGEPLTPTGGPVVDLLGGVLDHKTADEDWSVWPDARVGEVVRVWRETGAWVDYSGPGAFGDGTFSAADKGLPETVFVMEATIEAVDSTGRVTLSEPLATGDHAVRVLAGAWPEDGMPSGTLAGLPGLSFAKVMVGADGQGPVPHFLAVDVARDNRLPPQGEHTSTHTFAADCAAPTVEARLVYRRAPRDLALERGWDGVDLVMAEVSR